MAVILYERSKKTKALHFACFYFPFTGIIEIVAESALQPAHWESNHGNDFRGRTVFSPNRSKISNLDGKHENAEWSDKPAECLWPGRKPKFSIKNRVCTAEDKYKGC